MEGTGVQAEVARGMVARGTVTEDTKSTVTEVGVLEMNDMNRAQTFLHPPLEHLVISIIVTIPFPVSVGAPWGSNPCPFDEELCDKKPQRYD